MKTAIGIDFGGTFVKVGLVNNKGQILKKIDFPTSQASSQKDWLEKISNIIKSFKTLDNKIIGIGIGVPGFTDFKRGFIYDLPNVPGWENVPLSSIMKNKFNMPVYVDNDANAMAAGECLFGAGHNLKHAVFITLGTGVGGALLIDGKIYRGAYSMAGEVGHIPITFTGEKTKEGIAGLETFVGNARLINKAIEQIKQGKKTLIYELADRDLSKITPKIIAMAAKKKDKIALEILDFMSECLAIAFAGIIYTLQPQAIIIGGGVAKSGKLLFKPLKKHLKERLSPLFFKLIKILPAKLGPEAGVIGSASLAFTNNINKND